MMGIVLRLVYNSVVRINKTHSTTGTVWVILEVYLRSASHNTITPGLENRRINFFEEVYTGVLGLA